MRYGLGRSLQHLNPHPSFSAGILLANLLGCFLMGALVQYWQVVDLQYREAFAALILTGFLGSLTTFSTFILEIFKLSAASEARLLMGLAASHLVIGFFGLWAGHHLAQKWLAGA